MGNHMPKIGYHVPPAIDGKEYRVFWTGNFWCYRVNGVVGRDKGYRTHKAAENAAKRALKRRNEKQT